MVDRSQARAILTQARDILADRMTELVVEGESALLDDARGSSYMDEIGTVFEQIGGRLTQVNTMLANLPTSVPKKTVETTQASDATSPEGEAANAGEGEGATFKAFAQQIAGEDLPRATSTLAELFEIEAGAALLCATTFRDRWAADPITLQRTIELRNEIEDGNDNRALMTLFESFGLAGKDAMAVLGRLKVRFRRAA